MVRYSSDLSRQAPDRDLRRFHLHPLLRHTYIAIDKPCYWRDLPRAIRDDALVWSLSYCYGTLLTSRTTRQSAWSCYGQGSLGGWGLFRRYPTGRSSSDCSSTLFIYEFRSANNDRDFRRREALGCWGTPRVTSTSMVVEHPRVNDALRFSSDQRLLLPLQRKRLGCWGALMVTPTSKVVGLQQVCTVITLSPLRRCVNIQCHWSTLISSFSLLCSHSSWNLALEIASPVYRQVVSSASCATRNQKTKHQKNSEKPKTITKKLVKSRKSQKKKFASVCRTYLTFVAQVRSVRIPSVNIRSRCRLLYNINLFKFTLEKTRQRCCSSSHMPLDTTRQRSSLRTIQERCSSSQHCIPVW